MKIINPYMMFTGSFLPNWLLERNELNSTDKLVYARLCQFAGKNGTCFPRQDTLAEKVGMSENSVKKSLNKLIEEKLLMSHRRGQGQSNIYYFLYHEWMDSDRHHSGSLDRHHSGCVKENQLRESNNEMGKSNPTSQSSVGDAKASSNSNDKPCDKYNYEYIGKMRDGTPYSEKLGQVKKSYIAMLNRDYGKATHTTHKENLINGSKHKFFVALTTFLLEWDKQTPNRVKTFKNLVKCYYRNVFFSADEMSKHKYYWKNFPSPNQLLTENAIEVWENFWVKNPLLQIRTKEVPNEVKIQQVKEKEKFDWYLEEINKHLFDNSVRMVVEEKNKYLDLRELRDKIRNFRENWEKEKSEEK